MQLPIAIILVNPGYKSIREKYNLPLPIIEFDGLNVVVTFPRTFDAVKEYGGKAIADLSDAQIMGYEWLKTVGEASTREYSAYFDIGYKTAQRHLVKMKELGLIGNNGEDSNSPNYKYVVIND